MLSSIPNMMTLGRIIAIPGIVALFYLDSPLGQWLACGLFTIAALTDFLDGYLARAWSQQSAFGRFLDPVADKLLVAATILLLAGFGQISGSTLLPAVVILCREIVVSGLREFLAGVATGIPVTKLSKWKTALQMVAIGFLIVGQHGPEFIPTRVIGEWCLWIAAIITLCTGYDYLRSGLRHIDRIDGDDTQS
ncbi:MAG: CDP-diacylglycerol--glycerol-3-phosphate 3-phosphatidyltransferase [Pseudomonadota bacterium]|nr:CDP-diacylglycerol--glycerol-3-phosphate 3-phosphatidyltransferase [Pseudomonadota bacterium]MEC9077896.1 CDP-diacylglycerol--glycerol-3-phosphate 3-phosphatidyltransferase [Pseudomonadota bacterium]